MALNRLMVVDDALIMRMKIKEIAISAGWDIICEASNGEDAIALYEAHQPDLVTMDLVMPRLDGLSALRGILEHDKKARVVMVSAINQKEKLMACIEGGALDFVVKPFDSSRLKSLFERYFQT